MPKNLRPLWVRGGTKSFVATHFGFLQGRRQGGLDRCRLAWSSSCPAHMLARTNSASLCLHILALIFSGESLRIIGKFPEPGKLWLEPVVDSRAVIGPVPVPTGVSELCKPMWDIGGRSCQDAAWLAISGRLECDALIENMH